MGFRVNTRYAVWLELVLISVLVPNASFLGHLCGILAGVLYVEVPSVLPVLGLLSGFALFNPAPSYTYRSGTTGGASANSSQSHNVDDVRAAEEEEEFQEALRRSMQDTGDVRRGTGEVPVGGTPPSLRGRLRGDARTVEAHRVAPSAPPRDSTTSPGVNMDDMSASELRRRRLQRLGLPSVGL